MLIGCLMIAYAHDAGQAHAIGDPWDAGAARRGAPWGGGARREAPWGRGRRRGAPWGGPPAEGPGEGIHWGGDTPKDYTKHRQTIQSPGIIDKAPETLYKSIEY